MSEWLLIIILLVFVAFGASFLFIRNEVRRREELKRLEISNSQSDDSRAWLEAHNSMHRKLSTGDLSVQKANLRSQGESEIQEISNSQSDDSRAWLEAHNSMHSKNENSTRIPAWDQLVNLNSNQSNELIMKPDDEDSKGSSHHCAASSSSSQPVDSSLAQENVWLASRVRPEAQTFGISPAGAESLTASWLRYLGETDVTVTQISGDGGVDVFTSRYCCQVKNYSKQPVGASEVRDLLGTAYSMGLEPLIFTSSYLSASALDFSNQNGITAVQYSAELGTLTGINSLGESLLTQGHYAE